MLKDDNMISEIEFAVYNKWFDSFQNDIPNAHVIYLRTSPEIALSRVQKRSRHGEEDIPIVYLQKCHDYHENWYRNDNKSWLVLNADEDSLFSVWSNQINELLKTY